MKRPAAKSAAGHDPAGDLFGDRVRRVRDEKTLTLEQFAKLSGVSRAMLSKVERGEKSPTIGIAKRIAHALDVPLSTLIGETTTRRTFAVVRKNHRQIFRDPDTGFERHMLSPIIPGMAVEVVLHHLPPHSTTGCLPPYPAGSGKHVIATRGRVVVGVVGNEIALDEGDSLYFEADVEHWFENKTGRPSEYYLIISAASGRPVERTAYRAQHLRHEPAE